MKTLIKRSLIILSAFWLLPSAFGIYLQPFVYYGVDQFGAPVTNAITLDAWPPTNSIVGLTTNLVLNVPHTFLPDANGFVSNNIAPGNYRLRVLNYNVGVPFGIVSNATPINISQVGNMPVVTFLNFTLAQFSDAGTMAYRSTNDFALVANTGTIARRASNDFALVTSLGTISSRASNDFALVTSLGTIASRASNDFALATSVGPIATRNTNDFALSTLAGITGAQGYTSKTNDGYIGVTNLPAPANIATNGFIAWVAYKTNGAPGNAFTNLPMGSLLSTTNGQFYVLSNLTWLLK